MIRNIYCLRCAPLQTSFDEVERLAGWRQRSIIQAVKMPSDHKIILNGEPILLPSLFCDSCNAPIADGEQAALVTCWRTAQEPAQWEDEYKP